MSGPAFRLATRADAAELSAFAKEVFLETFGPANDPADINAYLAKAFTTEVQAAEIEQPGAFTVLAIDDTGGIAGYAFVAAGAPDTVAVGADPVEIRRFYVSYAHHGRGIAQALMDDVLERARELGARTIWLGVWEENARAIAFYRKRGFVQAGTQSFLLGSDLQSDWVMQTAL